MDFSRAFNVVRHSVLLFKFSRLSIPSNIHNWIASFLTGRSRHCRIAGGAFSILGLLFPVQFKDPASYLPFGSLRKVIFIHFHPLSLKNADETNVLVAESTDIPLSDEVSHIRLWAEPNGLIINLDKAKQLVLHRSSS